FGKFQVGDASAADDLGGDLAIATGNFGEPCNPGTTCEHGLGTFTLMCHAELPGTMCTRGCTGGMAACSDYGLGAAACVPVNGGYLCMPTCLSPANPGPCRPGYVCCNMGVITTTGPGACVPANGGCH